MERKRLVRCTVLILIWLMYGCSNNLSDRETAEVRIGFNNTGFICRSMDPAEDRINDVSIFIHDSNGVLEKSIWRETWNSSESVTLNLLAGK